jgi:hypothetical protein
MSGMILPKYSLSLFHALVYIVLCKIVALIYLWGYSEPRCGALVFYYLSSELHTFRGSFAPCSKNLLLDIVCFSQIIVLSSNTKKGEIERAFSVSLLFCVLDNNIRYLIVH